VRYGDLLGVAESNVECEDQYESIMSATQTPAPPPSELARVVDWRLRELMRAGYGEEGARSLADQVEIDLHRATDLLRDGCPEDVALRILL
jgi:hypothetical protein